MLFRTPTALLATVGFTAMVFVNNAYLVWAPSFLEEKFQLSLTEAGRRSMFYHHLAAMVGVLVGGRVSDLMVVARPQFRLQLQTTSILLAAPLVAAVGLAGSLAATCAAMGGMGLFRGLCEANTQATLFDVIAAALPRLGPEHDGDARPSWLGSTSSLAAWGAVATLFGQAHGLSYGFAALLAVLPGRRTGLPGRVAVHVPERLPP